ncbi:hypothetical protein WG906_15900 [Pedobacter sp. P351]|uniref:hypothetical protein n=1 Tax=Pedobacter superstes TaxID=3133441 RepID=UPI00309D5173
MESFSIEVINDGSPKNFEIIDYAHSDDIRCKFEIYSNNKIVASFEPDARGFLYICKNWKVVSEKTLHLIADKLEGMHF